MSPNRQFLTSALLGGCAGACAMDITQYAWAQLLERDRPLAEQDEETEAIVAVVELLTRMAPRLFQAANAAALGRAIHYVFGVAFAAAYLYLLPNRRPSLTRASVFGTLLWLLSDRILIPACKLGRPWSRYSVSERSNALASHVVYALAVEFSRPTR